MDHNRNETITPEDTEDAIAGGGGPRKSDQLGGREERDGFKGRSGEPSGGSGGAQPADASAHGSIPSKSHDL